MASSVAQICPIRPSRKKFNFNREERGDFIVSVCGIRVKDPEERDTVFPGWRRLERTYGLQPFACSGRAPTAIPSNLEKMPTEIIQMIFMELDIQSLFNLCQTNRWVRQHVVSCLPFQRILNLAMVDLRFFFQCDVAKHVTVAKFLDLLYEPLCSCCHREVGVFIFLPNMVRFCQNCLCWRRDEERLITVDISSVREELGWDEETLKRIPLSQTSELYYTDMMNEGGSACLQDVVDLYMELNDGEYPDEDIRDETALTATWASYPLDRQTNQPIPYYRCRGCAFANRSRFYDETDRHGELQCVREAQYTASTYLDHFEWCKAAQEIWRHFIAELIRKFPAENDNNQQ